MERNLYRVTKFDRSGYAEISYVIFAENNSKAKEIAFEDAGMTAYKGRLQIEKLTDNHVDSMPQSEMVFDGILPKGGVGKLLQLTPAQEIIIRQISNLYNMAKKEGIIFVVDENTFSVSAFNGKELKGAEPFEYGDLDDQRHKILCADLTYALGFDIRTSEGAILVEKKD